MMRSGNCSLGNQPASPKPLDDAQTAETDRDIYFLNMRDRSIRAFLKSPNFEGYPEFSRDGKWIAYVTDESGRNEVYVQSFPEGRGRWQISHNGGYLPVWAPDGKRLFYQSRSRSREANDSHDIWVVDVEARSGFAPGKPRRLMELAGYIRASPVRAWDISRDGRRFLTVKLEERRFRPITSLVLVQNWFEELKRLVPAGKK